MSNKISNVLTAIAGGLNTLRENGLVKTLQRGVINPAKIGFETLPAVVLGLGSFGRLAGPAGAEQWEAEACLIVAALNTDAAASDETLMDLVAEVDAAIDAVALGGAAGGHINRPQWEPWPLPVGTDAKALVAVGTVRIRVEGPLKI